MLSQLGAFSRSKPNDPDKVESILKKSRFNIYQEYIEGRQRRKMEEMKNDSILQERLAQETERDLMESEEQLSWNAYELPSRNRLRLIKKHLDKQRQAKEEQIRRIKEEVRQKEEGFTYHNSVLKEFSRWRDSPALFRYYCGHKGQVYAFKMSESLDCFLSASADTTLKLWDFDSGTCVRTFEGHGKAVRDCDLSPGFSIARRGGLGLAVSCSTDRTVRIWDARSGALRKEIRGHTDVVYAARFSPDGRQVCSASADCTVRLFDALEGHLNYIFYGHESAVVSIAYAPSGKYVLSSSDYGERAVKLWDAVAPATQNVRMVTVRIQWSTEGLISRITLVTDPPKALLEPPKQNKLSEHFVEKRQDPWDLLTDGEDEEDEHERRQREKGIRRNQRDAERELRDLSIQAAPDIKEAGGFTLSVTSIDRFGRSTQVDQYYGGAALQIVLRGVDPITEFFIGSYVKDSINDTFVEESGRRSGQFSRDLPLGARHTCKRTAINTRRFNAKSEIVLLWQAPPRGSGTLIIKATVANAVQEDGIIERVALSYTLTEVEPPRKGGVLSDLAQQATSTGRHATVFNFTASILHQLFIELIRNCDITEASNMLIPTIRLKLRNGLRRDCHVLIYKGKAAVMKQVGRWMANGVSIVKDARDLSPGKSMTVLIHGEPLESPPQINKTAAKVRNVTIPREVHRAATCEVSRTRSAQFLKAQCSAEARRMWEPTARPSELPRLAAASESMISDSHYGGNLPHLQMPLPFLYPINAKGFGAHDAARKGMEAMRSTGKSNHSANSRIYRQAYIDRGAQLTALLQFAQLRNAVQRLESSRRRDASATLPGFEKIGSELGTAANVRSNAALAMGLHSHPLPDRLGSRKLHKIRLAVNMGPSVHRGNVAVSLRKPLTLRGLQRKITESEINNTTSSTVFTMHHRVRRGRHTDAVSSVALSKYEEKPRLRRRSSFPTLPGLAARPVSTLLSQMEAHRFTSIARAGGGCIRTFWAREGDLHAHHHTVNQVAWSTDEKRVASCSNDKTLRLWAPQTGQCVRTLVGHEDAVMGCAFSDDGLRLVSCGMDNFLILWNTVNGEMLRRFFGHDDVVYRCVLFQNSSAMLSCSSDHTLKSWFLTPQPPDPPDPPTVTNAGQRAAGVAWRAPPAYNDDIIAYKIQLRVGLRVNFGNETTVDGATFEKRVDGLKPGQNYQFRICAVNRMGQGTWSNPSAQHVTDVGVPEAPEQPIVVRSWFQPRQIVFCWHAPLATVEGTAIQKFRVQCAGEGKVFAARPNFERCITWKEGRTLAQKVEAALVDQIREDANIVRRSGPATKGKTFKIPSDALDQFNQEAASTVDDTLSPEQLEGKLRRIDRRRRRTMKRLASEQKKRQESMCFGKLDKGILMAAIFDGLKPGFDYRCRVSAISSVGEGPFSPATYNARTPSDFPAPPAPPFVEAQSQTVLKVKWVPPVENGSAIIGFEIRRQDLPTETFDYPRCESHAYFDGLQAGKKYAFQIRAFNQVGSSAWSSWSKPLSTRTAQPLAPERPIVLESTIISITLRCRKPESSGKIITKIIVQRRELRAGGTNSEWANEIGYSPPPGGAGTACDFILSSLQPNSVFQFRCAAVNIHGQSSWSLPSFRARTLIAQFPTAPLLPRIVKLYQASADLAWSASDSRGSAITGHVIELKRLRRNLSRNTASKTIYETPFGDATEVAGIVTSLDVGYRNEYQAENLEPSAKYTFRVAACNGLGQSAWSTWSVVFPGSLVQGAKPAGKQQS